MTKETILRWNEELFQLDRHEEPSIQIANKYFDLFRKEKFDIEWVIEFLDSMLTRSELQERPIPNSFDIDLLLSYLSEVLEEIPSAIIEISNENVFGYLDFTSRTYGVDIISD